MSNGTFQAEHVAIVGLGLMGGSLARALRPYVGTITAVDDHPETREYAVAHKIVDHATDDLREGVRYADTVLLCAPVRIIIDVVERKIGAYLRSNTLLIDIGSTKQDVCHAMSRLPIGINAIGGHPMTGKEVTGVQSSDSSLYRARPFVLCPTRRTTPAAMLRALALVETIGAIPIQMEAARHDKVVAAISHLPYLLSAALVSTISKQGESEEAVWKLAAGGFRDMSRLAASDVKMYRDIMETNTQAIATLLALFRVQLAQLEAMLISHEEDALAQTLSTAREQRIKWYNTFQGGS
jgi:prephenate dehydrogenase